MTHPLIARLRVWAFGCGVCGRPPRWRALRRKAYRQHTSFCPRREK